MSSRTKSTKRALIFCGVGLLAGSCATYAVMRHLSDKQITKTWLNAFCFKTNDICKQHGFTDELPFSLVAYAILRGDTAPIEEYVSTGHVGVDPAAPTLDIPIAWEQDLYLYSV